MKCNYVNKRFFKINKTSSPQVKNTIVSGGKDASGTLHILELLKYVLAVLPPQGLKSACETVLRVMTLSHVVRTGSLVNCKMSLAVNDFFLVLSHRMLIVQKLYL